MGSCSFPFMRLSWSVPYSYLVGIRGHTRERQDDHHCPPVPAHPSTWGVIRAQQGVRNPMLIQKEWRILVLLCWCPQRQNGESGFLPGNRKEMATWRILGMLRTWEHSLFEGINVSARVAISCHSLARCELRGNWVQGVWELSESFLTTAREFTITSK